MALIQVSIDPVVVEALLLGTIGTIAVVVGAIALIKASPKPEAVLPRQNEKSFRL